MYFAVPFNLTARKEILKKKKTENATEHVIVNV
jgi:hypothetical protein